MATVRDSEIAATCIEKITKLRERIGYGDLGLNRCVAFLAVFRAFRLKYTWNGICGTDLRDWSSPKHQVALDEMTEEFLDVQGNGETYWPRNSNSPNFNNLQYTDDRTLITKTVKRLFFRTNLQQYRNKKYKHKEELPHTKRKLDTVTYEQPTKRSKFTEPLFGKKHIQSTNHQRPEYAGLDSLNRAIAIRETESISARDDTRRGHQTSAEQSSLNAKEDALSYIRAPRPSETCETAPPLPTTTQRKPTQHSRISPSLEKRVTPSSIHYLMPRSAGIPSQVVHPTPPPRDTSAPSDINFSYAVILSSTPEYNCKTWTPHGHLLEKSLNNLITEIPFDDKKNIVGLKIRLKGPGVKIEETLKCDEESKFEITKDRLLKGVKMCVKKYKKLNPDKRLTMDLEIEAWREYEAENDEDDEDSEIVFMF